MHQRIARLRRIEDGAHLGIGPRVIHHDGAEMVCAQCTLLQELLDTVWRSNRKRRCILTEVCHLLGHFEVACKQLGHAGAMRLSTFAAFLRARLFIRKKRT